MTPQILATDIAGNPFEWISAADAALYYANGKVAWDAGEREFLFRGGYSRSGRQSLIAVKPVIAIAGSAVMARMLRHEIPLGRDNRPLFLRDRMTCCYCAQRFRYSELTREHIIPRCKGGEDRWSNCATACRSCNQAKGSLDVAQFRDLVYVPYVPCRFEHFILSGRNVLADQHSYLAAKLPAHSRLL